MSPITLAIVAWIAVAIVVLRVMALARYADEAADRHWEELGRMRSSSGVGFFPTQRERHELELAIRDVIGAAL